MHHSQRHPYLTRALLFLVLQWSALSLISNSQEIQEDSVVVDLSGDTIPASNIRNDTPKTFSSADMECRIWLAPSTLKGAGLGMFAGTDFEPEEELLIGGDITVAITDITPHNYAPGQTEYGSFLWDEYTWSASALKMDSEGYETNVASEGFGSAANSFLPVYNVEEWHPKMLYNGLHRSRDPGAGATTSFHRRLSTAKRHISAGEEFYVSYGNEWFESRAGLGPIPLYEDLNVASSLLQKYTALQEQLRTRWPLENVGEKMASELWEVFVQNTTYKDSRVLIGSFHHSEPNELETLQSTFQNNVTAARIEESKRDLNWLREHGTCGDHIIAQPSTIPQASMGAFATRFLPVGTIVAQLPMIHVTNRSRFNMYALYPNNEGRQMPYNDEIIGQQLLLNYCFGHGDSSLLLCPYGPMVSYVNHNQSLANVKLRWGRSESGNHNPSLLNSTLSELETDATAKLAMEFISIRDIQEGEEIFLDYGDEWEAAWQKHVNEWKPVPNADVYLSAPQLEDDIVSRISTVFEEIERPMYPESVQTKCDSAIYSYQTETLEHYKNGTLDHYLWKTDMPWWLCSILRTRMDDVTGDYLYAIHLYEKSDDGTTMTTSTLIEDVPRAVIHFVDKPYTSDVFLPNAFRHDIRIPDEIFPEAWRNMRK